jgi:hypothetical protein
MMLCFGVAKELSMTLSQLLSSATREEIIGWSVYFSLQNDEQNKQMERARHRK